MPETDEQELAKALDSVINIGSATPDPSVLDNNVHDSGLAPVVPTDSPIAPLPVNDNTDNGVPVTVNTVPKTPVTDDSSSNDGSTTPVADAGPLDSIKSEALNELRPLVDKLSVSPEEKFDTYLMLIRSTDDMSLIAPAHEAARSINDETRKAQALLDIIKEIDYLTHQKSDK